MSDGDEGRDLELAEAIERMEVPVPGPAYFEVLRARIKKALLSEGGEEPALSRLSAAGPGVSELASRQPSDLQQQAHQVTQGPPTPGVPPAGDPLIEARGLVKTF